MTSVLCRSLLTSFQTDSLPGSGTLTLSSSLLHCLYPVPPLDKYINILENLSNRKVIAISINSENMNHSEIKESISYLQGKYGIPVFNPLEPPDSLKKKA